MSRRWVAPFLSLGLCFSVAVPPYSLAQQAPAAERPGTEANPLTLSEVLASLRGQHPKLQAAEAQVEQAEGKRFAAQGAWDPTLTAKGTLVPEGYYEYGYMDTEIRQATPLWGTELHAGYRLGRGKLPIYKEQYRTSPPGELRAGIDVPLWKNGPIDGRRAEIAQTDAYLRAAECERTALSLSLARDAAFAYFEWVARGRELAIEQELLDVAEARRNALQARINAGSAPPITAVDNERLILERQGKLVGARQKFELASLKLSLYLRDEGGLPKVASLERVPEFPPLMANLRAPEEGIDVALRQRPELCALLQQQAAIDVGVELADNQRAPKLDLHAYVARDLSPGEKRLTETEFGAGLSIELPVPLRKARGTYDAARGKAKEMRAKLRWARDQIRTEVQRSIASLEAAREQVELARLQLEAARKLAEAERYQLGAGSSDLVVVNLREKAVAEAARAEVEALAAYHEANVDYQWALGQGPLGPDGGALP